MRNDQTPPLDAARQYERSDAARIPPESRLALHLTPRTGWANDPNGFCFYQGEYHLYYQYYPYNTVWGPMHWGHAKSRDLLRWTYLPAALAPDTDADSAGCFSGSAIERDDGRLLLLYTGVRPATTGNRERQAQCVAVGDGVDFVKAAQNPVIGPELLPAGYSEVDFRDPKIYRGGDGLYYCVAGNRHERRQGSILLFSSADGLAWRFVTELASSRGELGRMWECPDFFPLDGAQVLLVSPQEMAASPDGEFHAGYGSVALLGDYDEETHAFTRRAAQAVDSGFDFYAPQTTLTPDGRRVMIAWMENWETVNGAPRTRGWFGRMSLPRELRVRDGRLCQTPVREIESLWKDEVRVEDEDFSGEASYPGVSGRLIDLSVTVRPRGARRFSLRFATDESRFTEIACDFERGELVFDRTRCGSRRDIPHVRRVRVSARDALTLRLILDGDCAELFVNGGERALSALLDTPETAQGISFASDGPLSLSVVKRDIGV